ncbi:phytoene desaturase family protein [Microterricola viridarii]|uniref:Phytoene desaturase n=1 Tax=Microterricola viridarii TaxID=412690 RepID=A0A1H1LQH3_9MICO|nr:phytoene desaturase family protein [Microterricola viridarii]SDR76295.1 phytoene desaturase [Microterricola viridarii]
MSAPTASVIGGGIAGLATAALLAADGYDVTLLEARGVLGGRAGLWEADGYRFDTGPSWYLMPEVFEHFYSLLGTSAGEQLALERLDPGYRVFAETGAAPIDIVADFEANVALFESIEPGAGAELRRYVASASDAYELALGRFLYNTFDDPRSLIGPEVLRRAPALAGLGARSLHGLIQKHVRDPRLQQVLGYPAVFLGSSPFEVPSLYHLMSHLDFGDGVYYPQGGFSTIIDSIAGLAESAGVRVLTGAQATEITTDAGSTAGGSAAARRAKHGRRRRRPRAAATGVRYRDAQGAEHEIQSDIVVSAADLHFTETALLSPELRSYPEEWWEQRNPGPGAVLVMLGVRGALPELEHHNLFFVDNWEDNFSAIYGNPSFVPEPASIYVCRPSATDPGAAPPNHENLFVLVPVPADPEIGSGGLGRSGSARVERAADAAIQQIAQWAGIPDLAQRIVLRRTVGPADFAEDLNSWRGGALGPAHTLRQSAFFRGRNSSTFVDGLYYVGGSTIPGIGLPMCLISAELVIKKLRGDRSGAPLAAPLSAHAARTAAGAAPR